MSRATKCATQEGQDRCSQSQVVLVADRVGRDMRHRQSVSPPSIATIPIYLIRAHHHVPLLEGRSEHCLAIADEGARFMAPSKPQRAEMRRGATRQ